MKHAFDLLCRIPFWGWFLLAFLAWGGCEDIRRSGCQERHGAWLKGSVVDTCIERSAK